MKQPKDYLNGKIYKIINPDKPGLVYYGSTINTLEKRMIGHRTPSNTCCSKVLFDGNGIPEIILVEKYPCNSKIELNRREGEYQNGNECINYKIAGRTRSEYYIDNTERILKTQNVKFECECGGQYCRQNKLRHINTIKHQTYISSNSE